MGDDGLGNTNDVVLMGDDGVGIGKFKVVPVPYPDGKLILMGDDGLGNTNDVVLMGDDGVGIGNLKLEGLGDEPLNPLTISVLTLTISLDIVFIILLVPLAILVKTPGLLGDIGIVVDGIVNVLDDTGIILLGEEGRGNPMLFKGEGVTGIILLGEEGRGNPMLFKGEGLVGDTGTVVAGNIIVLDDTGRILLGEEGRGNPIPPVLLKGEGVVAATLLKGVEGLILIGEEG